MICLPKWQFSVQLFPFKGAYVLFSSKRTKNNCCQQHKTTKGDTDISNQVGYPTVIVEYMYILPQILNHVQSERIVFIVTTALE